MPLDRLIQIFRRLASPRRWQTVVVLERIKRSPRYSPVRTRLLGPTIHAPDGASLSSAYRTIFLQQIYAFNPDTDAPTIIDGGANVGLSVIYFKKRFPKARIIAFEPDPQIADYCRRNLQAVGINDVDLRVAAVWSGAGEVNFKPDGADGGSVVSPANLSDFAVPAQRLRDVIGEVQGNIDLLKLDIEGAETEVLNDCRDVLGTVQRVFVEYHSFSDRRQTLAQLLDILHAADYRLHVTPENHAMQPFVERPTVGGMDLQLNIYAFRQ